MAQVGAEVQPHGAHGHESLATAWVHPRRAREESSRERRGDAGSADTCTWRSAAARLTSRLLGASRPTWSSWYMEGPFDVVLLGLTGLERRVGSGRERPGLEKPLPLASGPELEGPR